ncbi:MAG: pantoate--beta-alanine ligase [Phycisphaerae bacterium]
MKTVTTVNEVRELVSKARSEGKSIGLVPTMGALHRGHCSLVEKAVSECGYVVVSIFVNPTQFGPNEDLDAYPRTLEADGELCRKAGAALIFAPSASEMYPERLTTWVVVEGPLTETLCGASRPGHFRGVTTICAKLFNIVRPDRAYFGRKDAQQLAVIRTMVRNLNMPLEIVPCETVREESGLAMSSRNEYLSPEQRSEAIVLNKALKACKAAFDSGEKNTGTLKTLMREILGGCSEGIIDYAEIVDALTFERIDTIERPALAALAVRIGPARLIDNITLRNDTP